MSTKPVKTERDLTVQEVADIIGINKQAVYQLIRQGELEAYTPTVRTIRITPAALNRFRTSKSSKISSSPL